MNGEPQDSEIVISGIEGDGALRDKNDDKLGRATWASAITKTLVDFEAPEGFVVAIDGEWGSGKSSILNFISQSIQERGDDLVVPVEFNPWLYARRAELAQALITEIAGAVGTETTLGHKAKALVGGLASMVRLIPGNPIFDPRGAAELLQKLVADTRPLSELKADFAKEMVNSGKTVVVFVDDIDRLEPQEISDLFSALKVLGDFPNTIYVLALDSNHVAAQLEAGGRSGNGAAYVEKMVQVSFPVPMPQSGQLRNMLESRLTDLIGEWKPHLRDEEEWESALDRVLQVLVEKPRDLIRFTNAFAVTYPALRDQVNIIDLVLWEALRTLEPAAFRLVRANLRFFGLPADPWTQFIAGRDQDGPEQLDLLNEIRVTVRDKDRREAVERIIGTLFPGYADIANQLVNGRKGSARYHRRIADPETFRLVLSQQMPSSIVPTELIQELIAAMPTKQALDKWVAVRAVNDGGIDGAAVVFAEAKLHVEAVPSASRAQAMVNLMQCIPFDTESNDREQLLYELTVLVQTIMETIDDEAERVRAAHAAMEAARTSKPAVRLLRNIESDAGLSGEHSAGSSLPAWHGVLNGKLSVEALIELEAVAVDLIARDAAAGELLDMHDAIWLMHRWRIWDANTIFSDWFDALRADNARLKRLLQLIRRRDFLDRDVSVRPKALEGLIALETLAEDVRRLQVEDLSDEAQILSREFLKGLRRTDPPYGTA